MFKLTSLFIIFIFITKSSSMCLTEVKKLSNYTCVKNDPIGMGASGTVYLIEKDGIKYILKVQAISKKAVKEEERLNLLKGSAYVVQLMESVKTWDKLYIVLNYGSQGSMDEFMDNSDYFNDIDNVFSFFRKLVEGLGTIHERGLVHADIKLDNIVVNDDNEPIIIDFDNSAEIGELSGPRGTMHYMSPEMIRNFQLIEKIKFQPEMDFYAIGVLLYGIIKKEFVIDLEEWDYYSMMTYPILYKSDDFQLFFDITFGLLKPISHRIGYEKLSDLLEKAAFEIDLKTLGKDYKYTLDEFANEEEKPIYPNSILSYIYLVLAILFVVLIAFILKKCLVKKEKSKEMENKDLELSLIHI